MPWQIETHTNNNNTNPHIYRTHIKHCANSTKPCSYLRRTSPRSVTTQHTHYYSHKRLVH